jgi:lysophospholipase L1-like esterase
LRLRAGARILLQTFSVKGDRRVWQGAGRKDGVVGEMRTYAANLISLPLLPVVLAQGIWVRRRTPRLPDAEGRAWGSIAGTGPGINLVLLGKSTVAGVGASTQQGALACKTATCLSHQIDRTVYWRAIGRSGITARETLTELVPRLEGTRTDVLVIVLGVNDVLRLTSSSRWAMDKSLLIAAVRDYCGNIPVVLAGVPQMNHFPALPNPLRFVLGSRSSRLDAVSRRLADSMDSVLYSGVDLKDRRDLFCVDGFHPSEAGYEIWGERLAVAVAPLFGNNGRGLKPEGGLAAEGGSAAEPQAEKF